MYGWIWRSLPGGTSLKLLESLMLVAVVLALLFFVAFPVVEAHLPATHVNVDQ
jgi:hypothetical protein